jgi:hypothetical protein
MRKKSALTQTDIKHLQRLSRNLHTLDKSGLSDREIRQRCYFMGVFVYRQMFGLDVPEDMLYPGINSPVKSRDKILA